MKCGFCCNQTARQHTFTRGIICDVHTEIWSRSSTAGWQQAKHHLILVSSAHRLHKQPRSCEVALLYGLQPARSRGGSGAAPLLSCCMRTGEAFLLTLGLDVVTMRHRPPSEVLKRSVHSPSSERLMCIYTWTFMWSSVIKLQSDFNIRSKPECKRGRNQIYCTNIQRWIQDVFRRLEIRSRQNLTRILIQLLYVK